LGGEPLLAVRERRLLAVHHGLEDDLATPQAVHVPESALGVLQVEVPAVVGVREEQVAVAAVIGVLDADHRYASHPAALPPQLLDRAPTLLVGHVADHQVVPARLDADEVELTHEILAEPASDEGDVAVDLAGLEEQVTRGLAWRHALPFLRRGVGAAALDVVPHAETEVVGVETPGNRTHDLVVSHEE